MIDVDTQIEAVERGVHTSEVDGTPSRVQTLAQAYAASLEDVWEAITSPERIQRWFLPVTGDLQLGGRYQLEGNASGSVLECAPPDGSSASYRVTWEFGGGVTWLTVRLTATGDETTLLELEHVAPADIVPEEMWDQLGPAATGIGWDGALLGLALHLTDPDSVPDDPEAWQLSEEGKRFSRRSADAWAFVHATDGTDTATAQAAADAVYAMYAGETPGPM